MLRPGTSAHKIYVKKKEALTDPPLHSAWEARFQTGAPDRGFWSVGGERRHGMGDHHTTGSWRKSGGACGS